MEHSIAWTQKIVGNNVAKAILEPLFHEYGLWEDDLKNILRDADITDDSYAHGIEMLRSEHAKASEGRLRQQHLNMFLTNKDKSQRGKKYLTKNIWNHRMAGRTAMLVDLGFVDQFEVGQLVTDPNELLPACLEREQEKAIEVRQKQCKEKHHFEDQEKTREVSNPWLFQMDMADGQVMKSLLQRKLRSYHQWQDELKFPGAVEEYKRLCLSNQLMKPSCVILIGDVFSPMPVIQSPVIQYLVYLPRSQSEAEDEEEPNCF